MPHFATGLIVKRSKPVVLRYRMQDILEWRKDNFDRRDIGNFMRELAKQVKQKDDEYILYGKSNSNDDEYIIRDVKIQWKP